MQNSHQCVPSGEPNRLSFRLNQTYYNIAKDDELLIFSIWWFCVQSINCFGYRKSGRSLVVEVDEPSKGLRIQGKVVKKGDCSSDGFWSTSTCGMDHNITIRSQSSNPPFDPRCSTSNSTEFVNYGNFCTCLMFLFTINKWTVSLFGKKSQRINIIANAINQSLNRFHTL